MREAAQLPQAGELSIKSMLEFIERWVAESPVRKWKMTLDESGWHACVWFNRYTKSCFQSGSFDLRPAYFKPTKRYCDAQND